MGRSIWQSMELKGYSRREFLQFCAAAATAAGLGQAGVGQVVEAFETKEKVAVLWLHFHECACCSEAFTRALHPVVADGLLDIRSLNYARTLAAVSGLQANDSLAEMVRDQMGRYIVLVEGGIPTREGDKTAEPALQKLAANAAAVMSWGSCASGGCVQAAGHELIRSTPIDKLVNKPVINVPGCPPIGDVMTNIVTHLLVSGEISAAERVVRRNEYYGRRMHTSPLLQPRAAQDFESSPLPMAN